MKTYRQKPPEVQAIKWSGTYDGFQEVRAFFREIGINVGWLLETEENQFTSSGVSHVLVLTSIPGANRVKAGDWITFDPYTRVLDFMKDAEFRHKYEEVSDDA